MVNEPKIHIRLVSLKIFRLRHTSARIKKYANTEKGGVILVDITCLTTVYHLKQSFLLPVDHACVVDPMRNDCSLSICVFNLNLTSDRLKNEAVW